MPVKKVFFDSNIILYMLSADTEKANLAEEIIKIGGFISAQVLNEITNVMRKKLGMDWSEIETVSQSIQSICSVESVTADTHNVGRLLAKRYSLNVYDAMIVSSALLASCEVLYSEDMQDSLVIENRLRIQNPFKK